ncbi:beta-lactamase/transpeptidase-like protein [Mycena maculata]|uniref:Beta-lactamase/transpeptidase-like protein n=1 Tax=Mycena maculata TaxID=230809 RepID=A0AAD7KB17_9AGAR|nr:beta-lactamase/transpeptidase-like protein [Mycena maculata]
MRFASSFPVLVCKALFVAYIAVTANVIDRQIPEQAAFDTKEHILTAELGQFIEDLLRTWNSPGGIALAVVQKDQVGEWNVETKGYGVARSDGSKVTPGTLFAIGSNTKLFDVLAAGLLIHNSSIIPPLTWETKMASILPTFELMDPISSEHTTITDIISHRTGLPRHDLMYSFSDDIPSLLPRLQYLRPSAEFRETSQYNSIMYMVLSYLPTAILPTKIPFTRYVTEHILNPLGMRATTFSYTQANASQELAEGFGRPGVNSWLNPFSVGKYKTFPFWSQNGGDDGNVISGAGGMITNVEDLATWLQFLLLKGRHPSHGVSVVPESVIRKASTGLAVAADDMGFPEFSTTLYGGGQIKTSYKGHEMIGHGGAAPGFRSQIFRFPLDNFGLAILSNDDVHGNELIEIIKLRIVEDVFGLSFTDWNTRYRRMMLTIATRAAATTTSPVNITRPSIQLDRLPGKYSNPSYGSLELCPVSCPHAAQTAVCKDVILDAPKMLSGAIDPTKLTFVAKWDKVWSTHLVFTHFNMNVFNVTVLMSIPTNDPEEPFWVTGDQFQRGVTMEFAEHHNTGKVGFGLMGNFWGAGPGVHGPQGETLCHRSEVLFEQL